MSGVTFRGFEGTSGDDRAITLACGSRGCHDIVLDKVNIKSSKTGKAAACSCTNVHGIATSTVPSCHGIYKWSSNPYSCIREIMYRIKNKFVFVEVMNNESYCFLGKEEYKFLDECHSDSLSY